MPDAPEVVVIIGAYRRREYLLRAVRSVLAQNVDRARFEILVTKDFLDPGIDTELARLGVASIVDEDPRIGTWLGRAIRATTAPLVAFLDDDDEFEPDRLARVLQIFHDHPEVGFYRNRVRVIDAEDRPIPPDRWRGIETDSAFDSSGPVVFAGGSAAGLVPFALRTTRATFNSSTMVLRRSLLVGPWCELFARTQLPDLTLFLAAALGPQGLFFDDRRLTRYRFYGGNVTHQTGWLAEAARSRLEAAELARSLGRSELETWLSAEGVHYERLYRAATVLDRIDRAAPRRDVARGSAEYLRFLGRHPDERASRLEVWVAAAFGVAYCVAPGLTRRARAARLHSTATGARPPAGPGPTSPASPGPRGRGAGE